VKGFIKPSAGPIPSLLTATTCGIISPMVKIRRSNHIFVTWIGDHAPRHVDVYKDGRFVVKWDLDNWKPMKGTATNRVLKLLQILREEGIL